MSVRIIVGDCLDAMPALVADSIDSIVTDPPYHLTTGKRGGSGEASDNPNSPAGRSRIGTGFMGKEWDGGEVAFRPETWAAALRIAKPGAHLLAFGGTRTFHRLMVAIEDAGWEIRDTIMWVYGSGFPKSLDVSKAIDREAEAIRPVVGMRKVVPGVAFEQSTPYASGRSEIEVTSAASAASAAWDGWGTALKPAWEPIIVARKPLVGTVAANVLQFGTGAFNIDASRIAMTIGDAEAILKTARPNSSGMEHIGAVMKNNLGRWPANLIHDGSDEVVALFPAEAGAFAPVRGTEPSRPAKNTYGEYARGGGAFHGDIGSAARFFYCAKADREDRNIGCEALPKRPLNWSSGTQSPGTFQSEGTDKTAHNNHPTVKPAELMAYLVRLVTPPGGTVLDPFAGSGSTGLAADRLQFNAVLIELDSVYAAIAEQRIRGDAPLFAEIA